MRELREQLKRKLGISDEQYNAMVEQQREIIKNPPFEGSTIDEAFAYKIKQLKGACSAAIFAGFASSVVDADGVAYEFGFNALDQQNFDQQYLLVVSGDNAGAPIDWKSKSHGVIQLDEVEFTTVVGDAKAHKLTNQQKYWQLEGQVEAAAESGIIEDVLAINWE